MEHKELPSMVRWDTPNVQPNVFSDASRWCTLVHAPDAKKGSLNAVSGINCLIVDSCHVTEHQARSVDLH